MSVLSLSTSLLISVPLLVKLRNYLSSTKLKGDVFMRYSTPKLKFALAGDALIHFFNYQYSSIEEINFTENFCQSCYSDNFRKLKLRVLCEENNDIIVAAVLADANPEEQTFLYGRYRRNLSFVNIGMNLHIHPNGLVRKVSPKSLFCQHRYESSYSS